jgi:hypothetical protein
MEHAHGTSNLPPGGSSGNPQIHDIAPDVITIGPDYSVGGDAFEVYDASANVAFRTMLDVGDALDAALRMVAAVMRLRHIIRP